MLKPVKSYQKAQESLRYKGKTHQECENLMLGDLEMSQQPSDQPKKVKASPIRLKKQLKNSKATQRLGVSQNSITSNQRPQPQNSKAPPRQNKQLECF